MADESLFKNGMRATTEAEVAFAPSKEHFDFMVATLQAQDYPMTHEQYLDTSFGILSAHENISYRATVTGTNAVASIIKDMSTHSSLDIYKQLIKGNAATVIEKRRDKRRNIVVNGLNLRFSEESTPSAATLNALVPKPNGILFRLKNRHSQIVKQAHGFTVKIEATIVKSAKKLADLNDADETYEVEVELTTSKDAPVVPKDIVETFISQIAYIKNLNLATLPPPSPSSTTTATKSTRSTSEGSVAPLRTLMNVTDLVYVDEELPEIEIRELVSMDDFIRENPTFVALSDDYIEALAGELLGSPHKGIDFLQLHKRALELSVENTRPSLIPFVRFLVDAHRRNVEDDDDDENEEFPSYLTTMESLRRQPYTFRQAEMARLSMPFDVDTANHQLQLHISGHDRANIILHNGNDETADDPSDSTLLFGSDGCKMPIREAAWAPLPYSTESYIFETQTFPALKFVKPSNVHTTLSTFLTSLQPTLQKAFYGIPTSHAYDHHILRLLLSLNGIEYDRLTERQLAKLADIGMATDDDEIDTSGEVFGEINLNVPPYPYTKSFTSFAVAIDNHLSRIAMYMTDSRMSTLQLQFDSYLSAHPQYSLLEGVDTPLQIIKALLHNTQTLTEVTAVLKEVRDKVNTTLVRRILEAYSDIDVTSTETLKKKLSLIDLEDTIQTTTLLGYIDIHEVKQGNDTSMYEGVQMMPAMFVDVPDVPVVGYDNDDLENSDDETYDNRYNDIIIPDHPTIARSPDHLIQVFRKMRIIAESSGLSWDYNKWLECAFHTYTFPASRFDRIKNISSVVSEIVIRNIAHAPTLEAGINEIGKMSNVEESQKIRQAYTGIYTEWVDTCKMAMNDALAFWALDILDRSLSGTLNFKLPNNQYAHYWSPYGPPIESSKATRGVFVYIAHMADVEVKVLLDAAKKYPEVLDRVKGMKKNKLRDKVDELQTVFIDALAEHNKKKKDPDYFLRSFVPMYLNLPSVIAQHVPLKKQAIWAQGCCLAALDSTYEGDIDFRYNGTNTKDDTSLYYIKEYLGKKRWLRTPRPAMCVMQTSKHDAPKLPVVPEVDTVLPVGLETPELVLPRFDIAKTLEDIAPNSHITAYTNGSGAFRSCISDMVLEIGLTAPTRRILDEIMNNAFLDVEHVSNMIKCIINITHTDVMLNIKRRINPSVPLDVMKYMMVSVLKQVPANLRAECLTNLKNLNDAYTVPSATEVQDFINKKREEQKRIKLKKLDDLTTEDREIAMYAKKVGILKYADIPDQDTFADAAAPDFGGGGGDDAEGEAEFTQRPTDDDNDEQ